MPYFGSNPKTINTRYITDHQEYIGTGDTSTNSGYYTFYANYTPGQVSVIIRGVHLASSDYLATNGTDIRILQSSITLNADDVIEIIGHTVPASQVLERSDVNITGGQASNLEKVDAKYYMNRDTFTADMHVPAGYNAFFAGPVNFTGTINVEGVLNVI